MEIVRILLFRLNVQEETYEELEINEDTPIKDIFKSNDIIFIVDAEHSRVWVWKGSDVSIKKKILSTQLASKIRDQYGITYHITSVDEGSEPADLKELLELE